VVEIMPDIINSSVVGNKEPSNDTSSVVVNGQLPIPASMESSLSYAQAKKKSSFQITKVINYVSFICI